MSSNDKQIIQINNLNKWYGDFHALNNINLTVNEGEIVVICGPSGSGKSTLIRCINYLEKFQEGEIIVDGTSIADDVKKIRQVRSEVSMVFQHFNLFPHLTILDNLTLAPIEKDLINFDLLTVDEKNYLFKYHLEVYSKISEYLNPNERKWLASFI